MLSLRHFLLPLRICTFMLLAVAPVYLLSQQPADPLDKTDLNVSAFRTVDVKGATEICEGGETTLEVDGEYESYKWNNGSMERSIKVKEAGIYEVTVKTKGGCTLTTSVNVRVRPCT